MPLSDNFTPAEIEDIIASAMKLRGLKRADAEKFLNRDRHSKRNPLLERQWVRNLNEVCDVLREGHARPQGLFESVFWIRLYGALVDLPRKYRKLAEFHQQLLDEGGRAHRFTAASAEVFHACVAIRDALSDDELIYATFLRHVHAHVYQDSFEYEIERGNPTENQPAALRTKQMISPIRRHVDVDQAHEIVDKILKKANDEDARVTVNFAHKVGPHIERLVRAMATLDEEREADRNASAARRALTKKASDRG